MAHGSASVFKTSIFLALLIVETVKINVEGSLPKTCSAGAECPSYKLINATHGYEIRHYKSSLWISTATIKSTSFVDALIVTFNKLQLYIQGNNKYKKEMEMTAPILTKVIPRAKHLSRFTVSLILPAINKADPPPAKGVYFNTWECSTYVAVKQFHTGTNDPNDPLDSAVAREEASLRASLKGSVWEDAIAKSRDPSAPNAYLVAQYNVPAAYEDWVNEIWITFDMKLSEKKKHCFRF